MRKLILLLNLLCFGIASCDVQGKDQQPNMAKNSLLWKVSGKGLSSPSYLFGTMHLICPDDYFWSDRMQKAFDQSQKVVFEMDMDDPMLQMQVSASMLLGEGESIRDFLSEAEYEKFANFFEKEVGMPLSMMEKMKPMAFVSMLSMKSLNCASPVSYEGNIMQMAQKKNKEILGLENAEEQIAVFSSLSTEAAVKQLLNTMDDWEKSKSTYSKMVEYYKEQDLVNLNNLILESPDFKGNLNVFLYDRNKKWIPKMEAMMAKNPSFIAVGAGHLLGEEGVIELLRAQGYKVEPIP